jgi:hypothetical protein
MKARVWARVAASGAPAAAAVTAAAGLAPKLGAWGLPLALVAFVSGGVAGVALERAVLAPGKIPVKVNVEVAEPLPPAPVPAPEIPAPAPAPAIPPPVVKPRPSAPTVAAPSGEERQLIEAARTALLKRDPVAALHAISRHRAAFSSGQLAEERDSLEVQALMQQGQTEQARAAAVVFLKRFPQSVFGPAVEAALGD